LVWLVWEARAIISPLLHKKATLNFLSAPLFDSGKLFFYCFV